MMPYSQNKVLVFDLDDTLYKEIDFLISGYRYISDFVSSKYGLEKSTVYGELIDWYYSDCNPFKELISRYHLSEKISTLLAIYRNHYPSIALDYDTEDLLRRSKEKGVTLGLITDGRGYTQRNKIRALGLERFIDNKNIVISEEFGSEKPSFQNFEYFMTLYPNSSFVYVGDNPKKDFITPNILGWITIMLSDDGRNIHKIPQGLKEEYQASFRLDNLSGIIELIGCQD